MIQTYSRERLLEEVESLAAIASTHSILERKSTYWVRIEELRALFRQQPDLFDPALLKWLRRLAEGRTLTSTPQSILQSIYGYADFRPGQEEIIEAVIRGHDCVGVMPTGAGKSLTYQIPARILPGTTLVISPLIALMKDQVDALTELGIQATFINSSLEPDERRQRIGRLLSGGYDLVYVAPEGLDSPLFDLLSRCEINLIAVDEAHCISHWGHDFRPAYRNLSDLKEHFGQVPVLALTATATDKVADDISQQMGMIAPFRYRGSFYRPNLRLHAYKKGNGRKTKEDILRLVQSRKGQSGIIYCLSRKGTEQTADYLESYGIRVMPYHAGLAHERRMAAQEAFRRDDVEVITATVAFGMGIDKPNVRYIIHRDMPKSIDGYYQEIGRAGRDGVGSDCILFYSWSEVIGYERFLSHTSDSELRERQQAQTKAMFYLAEHEGCRHKALVAHFGEDIPDCGRSCEHCEGRDLLEEIRPLVRRARKKKARGQIRADFSDLGAVSEALLEALRQLRRRLADEKQIPAYLVFSDAVLLQMAAQRPQDEAALLQLNGVGPKKLATYGASFLALLRNA